MEEKRHSHTIVIQTFRNHNIPPWIQRCLDSVRDWARLHSLDYSLAGDEFYDLCGPEFLARGPKNPQAITNLARLVATRRHLDAGYRQVIWMDADLLVFDPERLVFDFPVESLPTGYAFGREVWIEYGGSAGVFISKPMVHNAATYFTQAAVDLDMLIALIRHIDAGRRIVNNFQIGVRLLRGLQHSLMFPTFSHASMFSPTLLRAVAEQNEQVLQVYGRIFRYQSCAGNLCLGSQDKIPLDVLGRAMDRLLHEKGAVVNRHATEACLRLVPYDG